MPTSSAARKKQSTSVAPQLSAPVPAPQHTAPPISPPLPNSELRPPNSELPPALRNPHFGLEVLRNVIRTAKDFPRQPKQDVTIHHGKPLQHGWLLPFLLRTDALTWRRWDHWARTMEAGKLLHDPIPQIHWSSGGEPGYHLVRKMWTASLNSIVGYGYTGSQDAWMGWSSWTNFNYLLDWLLFGFGQKGYEELPKEPVTGAHHRLYQVFCLEAAIAWPHDHFGDLLAESAHGRHNGFYPTPMHLVECMTRMLMGLGGDPDDDATPNGPPLPNSELPPPDSELQEDPDPATDPRTETVCDPCVGTGRMPLCASNHRYCLYGMDKDLTVIKATLVNGFLYAPWLVRPFPFLEGVRKPKPTPFDHLKPISDTDLKSTSVAPQPSPRPKRTEPAQLTFNL